MTFFAWLLIVLFALNAIATIAQIGKPKKRTSRGDAIGTVIVNGLLIFGVAALFL